MKHTFPTAAPIVADLELRHADLQMVASEVTETTVEIAGHAGTDASEVTIEMTAGTLVVRVPRSVGLLRRGPQLRLSISLPTGSSVRARSGSGDLDVSGSYAAVTLQAGSGDIRVDTITQDSHVSAGSGDVTISDARARVRVDIGSGDVRIEGATAELAVKAGSGDVTVAVSSGGVAATTGSGDVQLRSVRGGELWLRTGSGDVDVAVPRGIPVWTDILAAGGVRSQLTPRGEPAEGEDHVRVHAQVGSGSVRLHDA